VLRVLVITLRSCTAMAAIGVAALASAQSSAPPATISPEQQGQAAMAAHRAMQAADQLSRQQHFQQQMRSQRNALIGASVAPSIIQADSPPPLGRAAFDTVANATDPTHSTTAPTALVLVSLSMPASALREIARQATRIGAPLVLRGLKDNAFPATQRALATFGDIPGAAFVIDPSAFRRFQVTQVPTFILPLEALAPCENKGCPPTAHVRVAGEAGMEYWLTEIENRASEPRAKQLAHTLLKTLETSP